MRSDIRKPLLEKLIGGYATEEEIKRFNEYLETLNSREYSEFLDEYEEIFSTSSFEDETIKNSWSAIQSKIDHYETTGKREEKSARVFKKQVWLSIAASLLLVSSFLLYTNRHRFVSMTSADQVVSINESDIKPGENRAILRLYDGSSVDLGKLGEGTVSTNAGLVIKAKNGQITYQVKEDKLVANSLAYNTLETPNGGQFQMLLPDGSSVWLNASSKLKFPVRFSGNTRRVELSGEAYFEVAKDKERPFIVSTEKELVKVLGTHFNISSYGDEVSRTTLVEGKVEVSLSGYTLHSSRILLPGQQSVVQKNRITVQNVEVADAIAWKNGDFMFNDEEIGSVMRKLARWYDVEIVYQDPVHEIKIWGSLSRFKNISEVLNVIELTKLVKFKVEGRRVYVMKA